MLETGEVVETTGESVTVSIKRTAACAHCSACSQGMREDEMRVTAQNRCDASMGDKVRVELNPEAFVSATLIMYGFPLIGLMAGAFLGTWLCKWLEWESYEAIIGFILALAFAAAAYSLIKKLEPVWQSKRYMPSATGIVMDKKPDK